MNKRNSRYLPNFYWNLCDVIEFRGKYLNISNFYQSKHLQYIYFFNQYGTY